jgi:hypothetical protein
MVRVEKGIPLPVRRVVRDPIYPFDKMQIGESFFVEETNTLARYRLHGRLANHKAQSQAHRDGAVFTIRSVPGGVRVWRLQ